MTNRVPVVSLTGKQLMPTSPKRAKQLLSAGKAKKRWIQGIFYIQLTERADGIVQVVATGIDPGSKKEAFSVITEKGVIMNIQIDAITHVKERMYGRRNARKGRRFRNTPNRACRNNRGCLKKKGRIPASTKARWNHKLRIIDILMKILPIVRIGVEDVSAKTKKGKKHWNVSFSPLEVGKIWFYREIASRVGRKNLVVHSDFTTSKLRKKAGLVKSKKKMAEIFSAHCVDAYVSASIALRGFVIPPKPNNENIILMTSFDFYRRQLHKFQPDKGGIRTRYGGTNSLGFRKGSLIKHPKYGIAIVGGWQLVGRTPQLSLLNRHTGKRFVRSVRVKDCKFLCYNSWATRYVAI